MLDWLSVSLVLIGNITVDMDTAHNTDRDSQNYWLCFKFSFIFSPFLPYFYYINTISHLFFLITANCCIIISSYPNTTVNIITMPLSTKATEKKYLTLQYSH